MNDIQGDQDDDEDDEMADSDSRNGQHRIINISSNWVPPSAAAHPSELPAGSNHLHLADSSDSTTPTPNYLIVQDLTSPLDTIQLLTSSEQSGT